MTTGGDGKTWLNGCLGFEPKVAWLRWQKGGSLIGGKMGSVAPSNSTWQQLSKMGPRCWMQYEPLHKKHVLRLLRCARPPLGFRGRLRFTSSVLLLLLYLETRFRFNCGTKQGRSPDASWVVVPNSCSHTPTTAGLVDIPSQTLMHPSPYHSVNEMPGGKDGKSSTVSMAIHDGHRRRREPCARRKKRGLDQNP